MVYEKILSYAKVKIMGALAERELQLSDISRIAGLSVSSVHEAVKDLVAFRIVSVRKVGKTNLYKMNPSSYYGRKIKEFLKTEKKFYENVLKAFIKKVGHMRGVVSISLFGSLARGKEFPQDIDVIVLCKDKKIKEEIRNVEAKILEDYGIHLSALVMKDSEYKKIFGRRDRFALEVFAQAKRLYGKNLEEIVHGKRS